LFAIEHLRVGASHLFEASIKTGVGQTDAAPDKACIDRIG